jgi:ankyrin repeat protein
MQDWQPTALLLAIDTGLTEAALLLIQRGADVEARTGFTGNDQPDMNALMWAAYEGQAEVVAALLDKGARIDLQNGSGHTALMIAAATGQADALQRLLTRGADPALRNRDGQTALDLARAAGHDALVRQLAPLTPPARP